MYCFKCGKEIENDSSFCVYCGAKQNNKFANVDNSVFSTDEKHFKRIAPSTENQFSGLSGRINRNHNKITLNLLLFIVGTFLVLILLSIFWDKPIKS